MSLQNKTFKNSHTTDNDIGLLKLVRLKYSTIDDVALDIILISWQSSIIIIQYYLRVIFHSISGQLHSIDTQNV